MAGVLLIGSMFAFVFLGFPIAFALGMSCCLYIMTTGSGGMSLVVESFLNGTNSFTLLALPLFMLSGELMISGGISQRLINFCMSLVKDRPGGLAIVTIIASMFFAAISGSGPATVACIGGIMIPQMIRAGYSKEFSTAAAAAGGALGPIIPPSNTMIVYAVAAEVSVARLFMGGFIPGILMGAALCVYIWFYAHRHNLPAQPKASWRERGHATIQAFFPILTPVILIVGICTGVCTATEAGALAVIYATLLNCVYNRGFKLAEMHTCFYNAFVSMAQICFIVMASGLFGWVVTLANIPSMIANALYTMGANKYVILLLINLIFLVMGMFLSINASLLIMTPVLVTLANMYDLSLVQIGVMVTLNLTIGLLTPPVGWNLYIMSAVSGLPFERVVKAIVPTLVPLVIALLLITYIPGLVTWLPDFLMGPGIS